ncbi:acyltransferase family protein [Kineococcus sp. SYSU DK001]|uniref:acyltransferase family protein n=1 Tax=Kineococcus sp. SYSU DK001 TaxID=3383122 RepID=UPI003D7E0A4B
MPDEPRDLTIDALRVLGLAAVVTGHWLVTGFATGGPGARVTSPLAVSTALWPLTWFLQTLGPLFFAAGFAAARRGRRPARPGGRLPVVAAVVAVAVAWAAGGTLVHLALSPLWFAGVLLVLSRLRPVLDRSPWWLLVPATAVALLDLAGPHDPLSTAARAVLAWSVPYGLGVAHARGRLTRPAGPVLAVAGAALVVGLVGTGPASAVGVPGRPGSPLNPPGAVAVGLAVAQVGVFLLLRPALRRPAAVLARFNRYCLPVYLLHLPVLCVFAALGVPGVVGDVAADGWWAARCAVLPALALTLLLACRCLPRRRGVRFRVWAGSSRG